MVDSFDLFLSRGEVESAGGSIGNNDALLHLLAAHLARLEQCVLAHWVSSVKGFALLNGQCLGLSVRV